MVISSPITGSSLPPTEEMKHDIVRASQHIYRVLLDAISHPGQEWQLIPHPHIGMERDLPYAWIANALMALIDHETRLHVVPAPLMDDMRDVLVRRTRTEIVPVCRADFVVADVKYLKPETLTEMQAGSLDYPDDGATIVVQVNSLTATGGATLSFTGPGVKGELIRTAGDLTPELIDARNRAVADYPLGIDMFVVDRAGLLMAIPRTTTITIQEGGF